jgi:hypothetical protein
MSHVEYRCPHCLMRHFGPPGGTTMKCIRHKDTVLVQIEDYNGPDFRLVDPIGDMGGGDHTKTGHIVTQGADSRSVPKRKVNYDPILEVGDKTTLQTIYFKEAGEKADGRWKKETLVKKIERLRQIKTDRIAEEHRYQRAKIEADNQRKLDAIKAKEAEEKQQELEQLNSYIQEQIRAALETQDKVKANGEL